MSDGNVGLEINKEYTVYGIVFWENRPQYYLCQFEEDEYPIPFDPVFFEVSNDKLSKYWRLASSYRQTCQDCNVIAFHEWASDPMFYEHLLDGEINAKVYFEKYRVLMDQEQM